MRPFVKIFIGAAACAVLLWTLGVVEYWPAVDSGIFPGPPTKSLAERPGEAFHAKYLVLMLCMILVAGVVLARSDLNNLLVISVLSAFLLMCWAAFR